MNYPKYCERCGCYIPDRWNFCPSCGKEFDAVLIDIKSGRGIHPIRNWGQDENAYDVNDVSDFILETYYSSEEYRKENYGISNYRLNMFLYFVQAEFMVAKNKPCFSAEILARPIGPIVQVVFDRYCMYGASPIYRPWLKYQGNISRKDRKLIEGIVHECAKYSTLDLGSFIHKQRPYTDAFNSESKIITNESLKIFFGE